MRREGAETIEWPLAAVLVYRWLWLLVAAVLTFSCTDAPYVADEARRQVERLDIWSLLEELLPSENELATRVGRVVRPPAERGPARAPEAPPNFEVIDLQAYILRSDGTRIGFGEVTSTADLATGDLAIVPMRFTYSDATTSASGIVQLRYVWDATANVFFAADPDMVVILDSSLPLASVQGVIYNKLLDSFDGVAFNNGQLPNAQVELVDWATQAVTTVYTAADGSFRFDRVPGDRVYTLIVRKNGFYPVYTTVDVPASGTVTGVEVAIHPAPSTHYRTTAVYGTIVDLDGDVLVGASVKLVDAATGEPVQADLGTTTNYQGEYIIANIPILPTTQTVALLVDQVGKDYTTPSFTIEPVTQPDYFAYDVTFPNHAPSAGCYDASGTVTSDAVVPVGVSEIVDLFVEASDPDGDWIIYDWQLTAGAGTLMGSPLQGKASFAAPDYPQYATVEVTVYDAAGKTALCRFLLQPK